MPDTVTRQQALHTFWSQFNLKAYDANTVPDDAMTVNNGKYLTYEVGVAGFGEPVSLTASLWYRSFSWAEITEKAETIFAVIGSGGILVPYTGGALWVKRGIPFAQRMGDEDDTIRRIVLNVEIEYFT